MKYRLKVNAYTPKGKAKDSKESIKNTISLVNKPMYCEVISDNCVYLEYTYDTYDKAYDIGFIKLRKAEERIRKYYMLLIHLTKRAKAISFKANWAIDKCRRWILAQFTKQYGKENIEDFEKMIKELELKDESAFIEFLKKPLFKCEIVEVGE